MTTPGGGTARPAGFSSPMGAGNMAKRASAAAAADLANLASTAAKYRKDMEAAAKAAEKTTAEVKKQQQAMAAMAKGPPAGLHQFPGGIGATYRGGNGGSPSMPPLPGAVGANAAQIPGLGGVDQAGVVPSGAVNGGGARFSGMARGAGGAIGKALGVAGAGAVAELMNLDNHRIPDFLANRAGRISAGGYNKTTGANLVTQLGMNSFRSREEQMQFFRPVLTDNRTGFAADSAGMMRMARGAQTTAALNPLAGGTAFQTSVNFGAPETFNRLRMMTGIETVGRGGQPKTPEEIARELVSSTTQGRFGARPMSTTQTAAALGARGGLRLQMNAAGFDQDMQSAISRYLEESAAEGRYVSGGRIRAGHTAGTDTIYRDDQRAATAKQDLTASYIEDYAEAVNNGTDLLVKAFEAAAGAIRGAGETARDAFLAPIGAAAVAKEHGGAPGAAAAGGVLGLAALAGRSAWKHRGKIGKGLRAIPGVGQVILGGSALYAGYTGMRDADYSGNYAQDAASIISNSVGNFAGMLNPFGDGPGENPKPRFGTAAFPGVAGAEMGDSEKGYGGRGKSTIQYLKELMARSGLPYRITSAKRSGGGRSYHDTGHAIDIAGPTPGTDTREMLAINKYLATKLGRGAKELIYSGPGGINLYNGNPHEYSAKVKRNHHDHVHVAVTEASLKRQGEALTGVQEEEGIRGEKAVARAQRAQRSRGIGRGRGISLGRQGRSGVGFSERRLIEDFFGSIGDRRFTASPAVADDPLEATATSGSGSGAAGLSVGAHAIDKFLYGLRMHESRGDYTAENGGTRGANGPNDSSASGAYQYIDSTWGNYRGYKYAAAAPPAIQDERARQDASRLYSRYGNWRMVAAAHFQGEGWLKRNSDPSKWDSAGNRSGGNPPVSMYVKSVLDRAGLPETGDGPGSAGSITADVPRPQHYRGGSGGGGNVQVDARRGGGIHIAKVEVKLTTPQVSEAEAQRIGKMVVESIARQARMSEMSR